MPQLTQRLLAGLPTPLRQLIASDSREELLKDVDSRLLLFETSLISLDSDQSVELEDANSATIAAAARNLLGREADERRIQLLLPPAEFIATRVTMAGVSRDNLESALALQADTLLPAYEEPLAMGVNPASAELAEEHVVVWLPQARLEDLFAAFSQEGLFLAAVKPRLFGFAARDIETRYIDEDSHGRTAVTVHHGVVMQWLQISAVDLDQPAFIEQWEQELKSYPTGQTVRATSGQEYRELTAENSIEAYNFYPAGALQDRHRAERGRRLLAAGVALIFLGFLAAIPFLLQSWEFRQAASTLAANSEFSAEARVDRAVVVAFEDEWGPVNDFPDQNIPEAMFTLQQALSPDQLSSMEISEGLISIEGSSSDPQAILQRLEQDPLFTDVVFARATNNNRYYIDLRLSPVNFESYMLRYFPDD